MGLEVFDKPALLPPATGRIVLDRMLKGGPLRRVWCDEDMRDKKRQQAFNTAVQRINRAAWPEARLKVRHEVSTSSSLIQLADVVAYGLSQLARELVEDPVLQRRLKAIRDDPQNVIRGPMAWSG